MIVGCVRVSGVWQTNGCTPLYVASHNGHVEVVRALVGAGAAVNQAKVRWGGACQLCSVVRDGLLCDDSVRVQLCALAVGSVESALLRPGKLMCFVSEDGDWVCAGLWTPAESLCYFVWA